jgi:peptidoglycan biosynthesis protein MviN/MurJ (putative lipid II flippase)
MSGVFFIEASESKISSGEAALIEIVLIVFFSVLCAVTLIAIFFGPVWMSRHHARKDEKIELHNQYNLTPVPVTITIGETDTTFQATETAPVHTNSADQ